MTDTLEQLSGRAAAAIADLHDELRRRFSELNTAEARLAEALLNAHATSETGRRQLQGIQLELVEAIANPVNALDTPAGERQFLMFLRGKLAEIARVVDDGALTARDQAELVGALGSDYLTDYATGGRPSAVSLAPDPPQQPAPMSGLGAVPSALGPSALGALPAAATAPAQSLSPGALGSAASPLAALISALAERDPADPAGHKPAEHAADELTRDREHEDPEPEPRVAEDPPGAPTPEEKPDPGATGPAQTRPAVTEQ